MKVYSLYPSRRHSACGFILSSCSGDMTPHLPATPLFNRHVRKSAGALGMCASSLKGRTPVQYRSLNYGMWISSDVPWARPQTLGVRERVRVLYITGMLRCKDPAQCSIHEQERQIYVGIK